MREPAFWWRKAGLACGLLAPAAACYGAIAARRMARPGARAGVPVLCVGNFTLGGAGKTPAVMRLAKMLQEAGERPFCLSRGYGDRKSTRLNSSHTEIYTLSLHDALPIWQFHARRGRQDAGGHAACKNAARGRRAAVLSQPGLWRSEEHTSELQSHRDLHSFPTRRSSDLAISRSAGPARRRRSCGLQKCCKRPASGRSVSAGAM